MLGSRRAAWKLETLSSAISWSNLSSCFLKYERRTPSDRELSRPGRRCRIHAPTGKPVTSSFLVDITTLLKINAAPGTTGARLQRSPQRASGRSRSSWPTAGEAAVRIYRCKREASGGPSLLSTLGPIPAPSSSGEDPERIRGRVPLIIASRGAPHSAALTLTLFTAV